MAKRSILIVGGGTAGWLTAAYLARFFDLPSELPAHRAMIDQINAGAVYT